MLGPNVARLEKFERATYTRKLFALVFLPYTNLIWLENVRFLVLSSCTK